MDTRIYLDPDVDLYTNAFVQVIIEFRIRPAHAAAADPFLSMEQAEEQVEQSHREFQRELETVLEGNQCSYTLKHLYKSSLNGAAIELQGKAIHKLLSSRVIRAIYLDREMKVPESPIM